MHVYAYSVAMRRKPGTLIPFEVSILGAGLNLSHQGQNEFHGYAIAKEIRDREQARKLAGQGTLYRALDRLENLGFSKAGLRRRKLPPRRIDRGVVFIA